MDFLNDKFECLAKTFFGLENVLADEIELLGGTNVKILNRAVGFTCDKKLLYGANLSLRTALRILVPLAKVNLSDAKDLYKAAMKIDWTKIFNFDKTISVNSYATEPFFRNSNYAALLVKDAISDTFTKKLGSRPDVEKRNPDIVIDVYVNQKQAVISIDASGDSLHRRGYRLEKNLAPLNEVLAAGIILLSEWDGKTTFIDSMCGSGTLPIEAAMIAKNIPPNLRRKNFAFKQWKNFDIFLYNKVRNTLKRNISDSNTRVIGSDVDREAVTISISNAERANVDDYVEFYVAPFEEFSPPDGKKHLIINPPYDERIKKEDIIEFYKMIGNTLKNTYVDTTAWIFTGNNIARKAIGLKPSRKIPLYNGPIESRLLKFEIYEGSRKKSVTDEPT